MDRNHSEYTWKGYLRSVLLFVLLSAGAIVALNVVVDPFSMFRLVEVPPWNSHKTGVAANNRLALVHRLRQVRPEVLIMGSSRTQIGINPEHPALQALGQPVYNAALRGTTHAEMLAYLEHALAVAPVGHLLLGLDFMFYNAARQEKPHYTADRLLLLGDDERVLPRQSFPYIPEDLAIGLLSVTGVKESVQTLRRRGGFRPEDTAIFANGMMDSSGWASVIQAKMGGQREFFQKKEATHLTKAWVIPPANRLCHVSDAGVDVMQHLQQMLVLAQERGVQVTLFLQPSHMRNHLYMQAMGIVPQYEDWLRQVVGIAEAVSAAHPKHPPIAVWDFAFPSPLTMEEVPEWGDRQSLMQGYLEFSHYTPWLGDKIVARMYDGVDEAGFGERLSSGMLDGYLVKQQIAVEAYRSLHSEEWGEIEEAVAEEVGDVEARGCE